MIKMFLRLVASCATISLILFLSACGGGDSSERGTSQATPVSGSGFSSGFGSGVGDSSSQPSLSGSSSAEISTFSFSTYESFDDELTFFNTSRWYAANWNNWGYFINGWHPNQLSFQEGRMVIKLEADVGGLTGKPAVSGEYRTTGTYKHGLYKARFMASKTPGTISGFFTYTGPANSTQHDEIDVEVKGDDPTKMQVNYWTNGIEHPTLINLGFDASAAYHDYAFRWTSTAIQWYVDDVPVYAENGSRGPIPVTAGQIMFNHWGTVGTSPWSTDYVVSTTPSLMHVERVSFTSDASLAAVVSVGALSASAYSDAKGWRATASATVRNASGIAVAGAVLTGSFTVGGSPLSCTSAINGICSITSAKINPAIKSTTFSATNITGTDMRYDSTRNVVASVVIAKP